MCSDPVHRIFVYRQYDDPPDVITCFGPPTLQKLVYRAGRVYPLSFPSDNGMDALGFFLQLELSFGDLVELELLDMHAFSPPTGCILNESTTQSHSDFMSYTWISTDPAAESGSRGPWTMVHCGMTYTNVTIDDNMIMLETETHAWPILEVLGSLNRYPLHPSLLTNFPDSPEDAEVFGTFLDRFTEDNDVPT